MAISEDTIEELATAPKKTYTDEGLVEERPTQEIIDAARHNENRQTGMNAVPWGMKIARTKPGSTTG